MTKILAITVALATVAVPAAAQQGHAQHGQGVHSMQGMEHCMSMMGGPPPAMVLQHQEALGLSADQVGQLERLRDEAGVQPHMTAMMAVHTRAAEALQGDEPDWPAYEAALRAAADHMVQAHTAMARAAVAARDVLTAAQLEQLSELDHGMGGMTGRMHGMGGMQGMGGEGAGHMGMMGCMMMGGMGGHGPGGSGHGH